MTGTYIYWDADFHSIQRQALNASGFQARPPRGMQQKANQYQGPLSYAQTPDVQWNVLVQTCLQYSRKQLV